MRKLAFFTLIFLTCAAQADGKKLPLKIGEPFVAARAKLLKLGWKPELTHVNDEHEGVENTLIEHKYGEVQSCAMDRAICILQYKKKHGCLQLYTKNEEIRDLVIQGWNFKCGE